MALSHKVQSRPTNPINSPSYSAYDLAWLNGAIVARSIVEIPAWYNGQKLIGFRALIVL